MITSSRKSLLYIIQNKLTISINTLAASYRLVVPRSLFEMGPAYLFSRNVEF